MEIEKKNTELEWYDNPNLLINLVIGVISIVIILSQAFAIKNNLSATNILISIMNHNSIYLFVLFYFLFLKTARGKQYFNYLNLGLIIVYFCILVAAFLTVFQSFGLFSLVHLVSLFILFIYMLHVFLKETKIWKELKLEKSPFNEISNEWYFLAILASTIVLLVVGLIETIDQDGIVLTLLDAIYMTLFSRYIYLYNEHVLIKCEKKKTGGKDRE